MLLLVQPASMATAAADNTALPPPVRSRRRPALSSRIVDVDGRISMKFSFDCRESAAGIDADPINRCCLRRTGRAGFAAHVFLNEGLRPWLGQMLVGFPVPTFTRPT